MKKRNKLSRIGSTLLAIMLVIGMAAADVEPVHAAEDSSTIDVSEDKTALDGASIFNFFGLGGSKVESDEKGVVKADDVEVEVKGSATEVIEDNKTSNTKKRSNTTESAATTAIGEDTEKPGLFDSLKSMFSFKSETEEAGSTEEKSDSPMSYTVDGDTIVITSIGTDSLAQGTTLLTDVAEADQIRHVKFNAPVELPANAFKNSNIVTVEGDITSIGESAFFNCHNLESIDLSKCTSIGKNAFSGNESGELDARYGMNNLTSIDLSNCASVGEGAFNLNEQLIFITSPKVNCTIGANAFRLGYMYMDKKEGSSVTNWYYSTSPADDKGDQVKTRTYIFGNAIGQNYSESIWSDYNREIIWDDTSVDVILSDKYETGKVPTTDDFEVYVTYDQGQPGVYVPEFDTNMNRQMDPQKVEHTATITNAVLEDGTTSTTNYKVELSYERQDGISVKTHQVTKYLNTIARTLTDEVVISSTDEYPEGTKGLVSFEWNDEKNPVSLPFYIKSGTQYLEVKKQGSIIAIADDDITLSLHRSTDSAAEATFTISAAPTDISTGANGGTIKSWQLNIKSANVVNGEYTTSNLASANGGVDIPFIQFSVKTGVKAGSEPQQPSDPIGDESLSKEKFTISGVYLDKDGKPISGRYVVLNSWKNGGQKTGSDGRFSFDITEPGVYGFVISKRSTMQNNVITGEPEEDWTHYDKETYFSGVLEVERNSDGYLVVEKRTSGEWFANAKENESAKITVTVNGSTMNIVTKADESSGATTPTNPTWSSKVTVSGTYKDVNGNPICNKYIALDTWDNAIFADKTGKFSFTVTDEKTHQIFFTNLNAKAANNAFNADDVVASISFNTSKNSDGNLAVAINEADSKLSSNTATATYTNSGSNLTVDVNTKIVNDDNEIAIGIDNMTLKSIKVSLDGVEGTEFSPYIDRVLTKEDFEIIAVYEYYKANGDQDPVATEYTTGLETKDWTSDKLTSEGLKVTGKEQSILFRYTYKGNTAEEVVKIKGSVQPVADIEGILKDANGKGMANYVVYLDTYDNSVMTDSEGKFTFDNIVDGTYKLYVTKSKKASTSVGEVSSSIDTWFTTTVTISNGKPQASATKNGDGVTSVNKVKDNVITFTIVYDPETTTKVNVRGTFKSSEDKAITDQYIVLDDWNNAVKADSNGSFKFENLEAGTYVLHFTNKNNKGSGSLGSSDYDYAKVNITIGQDEIQAKSTTYDGTTCDAKVEDGDIVITVKLSEQAEKKGTSNDTPTNQNTANSKVTAGEGKVEIKGVVTDANGTGKQGLAVVIDDYSKAVDTSSTGTFSITGVEDGSHTIAIHNVDKSKLATSGNVNVSDEKVLASYNVTVANGKVSAQNIGTNNVGQYAFSKENDDTVLNITTTLKAEEKPATTDAATADGANASQTTTNLLPKTGLDFLEQAGITDGIAKIVGYDSPIVAMLTPADTAVDSDGNLVSRVSPNTINAGSTTSVAGIIMLVIVLVGGVAIGATIIYKRRKENESSEG